MMMVDAESIATSLLPPHRCFEEGEGEGVVLIRIPQRYDRTKIFHFVDVYSVNITRITM
jgi:hypothetical protein